MGSLGLSEMRLGRLLLVAVVISLLGFSSVFAHDHDGASSSKGAVSVIELAENSEDEINDPLEPINRFIFEFNEL